MKTKQGFKFKIVDSFIDKYFCSFSKRNRIRTKFIIKFEDGIMKEVFASTISNRSITHPKALTVSGIGVNDRRGKSTSRESSTWRGMLTRCYAKHANEYKYYGGRGITVCDKWLTLSGFIEDIKKLPNYDKWLADKNYSLDKDFLFPGNKVYCIEKCSFQSPSVQCSYQRKHCGKNIGKSGIRGIVYKSQTQSWIVKYKGKHIAWRKDLEKAKIFLLDYLKKNDTQHPYVRFGLSYDGLHEPVTALDA